MRGANNIALECGGQPEEIVGAALYFASQAGSFTTGPMSHASASAIAECQSGNVQGCSGWAAFGLSSNLNSGQAELVNVPMADFILHPIPDGAEAFRLFDAREDDVVKIMMNV